MRTRTFVTAVSVASALLATPAFAQDNTTTFSTKPFTDVPTTHANYEAIEYLRKYNVLKGYVDGTYKPGSRINRAEFVKLIANPFILSTERLNDCIQQHVKDDKLVFFKDVRIDAWYAAEVCLAFTKELVSGYPDSTFRPSNYINFVEAAKILTRTFSLSVVERQGEDWFRPYVEQLDKKNAIPTSIKGFSHSLTRGEMAEILYRLKANKTTKSSLTYDQLD